MCYNNSELRVIKRGDIFYVKLDGIGSEQQGLRPILIVQNDIGNKFSPTVIGVAITSKMTKAKLPTHIEVEGYGLAEKSVILTEQIRTIDKKRIIKYIGQLDEEMMERVDKATMTSLKLGDTQKEKIAKEKAIEVKTYDLILARLVKYNDMNSKNFKDALRERELYLNDLISFCENNRLDYKDYYSVYGDKQKVAV